jgi:hypothetical protein
VVRPDVGRLGAGSVAAIDDGELASKLDGVRGLVEDVGRRWKDLQREEVPDRLTFTPGAGTEATTEVLRLFGYSPFDPLVVPADLEPSLWLLDGRPVAEVLAEIEQEHHVPLDDELLARLHAFGVALAPAPGVDVTEDTGRVLVLGGDRRLDLDKDIVVR